MRDAVYDSGNAGVMLHALIHVRDHASSSTAGVDNDDPGLIVAVHRLTRPERLFGQPASRPFDNIGVAYFGDVIQGQSPTTVIIPDSWFHPTSQVQVPNHRLLHQEMVAATPDVESFGPYTAGTPDVETVVTRQLVIVPNKYVTPFLTTGLTPKAAYQVLYGMITQAGDEVACKPLLDWLRVALTKQEKCGGALPPATCVAPVTSPVFSSPQVQQAFMTYRVGIFHYDFPHFLLRSRQQDDSGTALIAQALTELLTETRLTRLEAQQRWEEDNAPKPPSAYFGCTS